MMTIQKADIARVLIGQNVRDKPGPCNKNSFAKFSEDVHRSQSCSQISVTRAVRTLTPRGVNVYGGINGLVIINFENYAYYNKSFCLFTKFRRFQNLRLTFYNNHHMGVSRKFWKRESPYDLFFHYSVRKRSCSPKYHNLLKSTKESQ